MPLTVADIYCGAGGLSAGFAQAQLSCPAEPDAKFRVVYGLDRDLDCISTFRRNLFPDLPRPRQEEVAPCRSVVGLHGVEILKASGVSSLQVVIGGPNCQGVSVAGLRNPGDKRNEMFLEFHRLISDLQPEWFVMENVPGLVHANNRDLLRAMFEEFGRLGYAVEADVLLAADFGVAQLRYRLFVIGNRVQRPIRFPNPTHRPQRTQPESEQLWALPTYPTVRDAIGDLEELEPAAAKGGRAGQQPGEKQGANHVVWATTAENIARISHVAQSGDWRSIPVKLLPARSFATRASDQVGTYGRLAWDNQAYTITALAGNVSAGTFTHPSRNRPLSAREAARLQGFDDDFVFDGMSDSAYRQVGNAVPPPLAKAVATTILGCQYRPEDADEWGHRGRVTMDLLSQPKARGTFPILTPRHPMRTYRGSKAQRRRQAPRQALPSCPSFAANPHARVSPESAELARLRLEASLPNYVRAARRARAIVAYFSGEPPEIIAEGAGVSNSTIERWVNGFYRDGVEGWRAYHTPVERLAGQDAGLRQLLTEAIQRVRERVVQHRQEIKVPDDVGGQSSDREPIMRSYMNTYLAKLIGRFGHLSVSQLIELIERTTETQLGTIYVGDLLAICDILLRLDVPRSPNEVIPPAGTPYSLTERLDQLLSGPGPDQESHDKPSTSELHIPELPAFGK